MKIRRIRRWIAWIFILGSPAIFCAADTFLPLEKGLVLQDVEQLWKGYDPRIEPLEIETLDAWEDSGVICRIICYCVGTFHGKKAMRAALYGFPKGGQNLPGLVQIHGGGQHANLKVVMTNAHRDYARISIDWIGNQTSGFKYGQFWKWEGANTDWGYVNATQTTHNSHFSDLEPDEKTIDPVISPRNSNQFLDVMAAQRALTFLKQQPEVDGSPLGIYGHFMGAKLTFDTAAVDGQVKAIAPSCGAQPNNAEGLFGKTIATHAYTPMVQCPVIFIDPSNDFHGTIDGIEQTTSRLNTVDYQFNRIIHLNHRTQPDGVACTPLWFVQYLNRPSVHKAAQKRMQECCEWNRSANSKRLSARWSGRRMSKMLSSTAMKNLLSAAWKNSSRLKIGQFE